MQPGCVNFFLFVCLESFLEAPPSYHYLFLWGLTAMLQMWRSEFPNLTHSLTFFVPLHLLTVGEVGDMHHYPGLLFYFCVLSESW